MRRPRVGRRPQPVVEQRRPADRTAGPALMGKRATQAPLSWLDFGMPGVVLFLPTCWSLVVSLATPFCFAGDVGVSRVTLVEGVIGFASVPAGELVWANPAAGRTARALAKTPLVAKVTNRFMVSRFLSTGMVWLVFPAGTQRSI